MYNDGSRKGKTQSNRFGDYDDDSQLFMGNSSSQSSRIPESYGFSAQLDGVASIFENKRMKIPLPDEIIRQLQITDRQLVIITESGKLFRQQYDEYSDLKEVELPALAQGGMFNIFNSKMTFETLDRFYLDEFGTHCLLANKTSDTMYYWHCTEHKVKSTINKFPKEPTQIAFALSTEHEATFLVATKTRELYYAKVTRSKKTNDIETILSLIDVQIPKNPISSIFIYSTDYKNSTYTCVLLCDDQTFNYYYDECGFPNVFKKYEKNKSVVEEIPINEPGKLNICLARRLGDNRPHSFLYTTGSTLISLTLPSSKEIPTDSYLKNFKFMKYAKSISENNSNEDRFFIQGNVVKQIGLTEFHYFLVYEDCVTIMNRISGLVVETFDLNSMQGSVIDMFYNNSGGQRSMVIYSRKQIMKIIINNEESHAVFQLIKQNALQDALEISRRTHLDDMIPYISGLYGDQLFSQKQYVAASNNYVNSNRSFEEVMLKYMRTTSNDSSNGLLEYLSTIAKRLSKSHKVQNRIIDGISLEYFNYSINVLEKQFEVTQYEENLAAQISSIKDTSSTTTSAAAPCEEDQSKLYQLNQAIPPKKPSIIIKEKLLNLRGIYDEFMSNKWDSRPIPSAALSNSSSRADPQQQQQQHTIDSEEIRSSEIQADQKLAYEIMQNHGRLNDCLDFAKQRRNYENVITHYVNEQNFKNAIGYLQTLSKEQDQKRATEITYKFAYILVQREPELFFKLIITNIRDFQPMKLISAIMNIPPNFHNAAVRFLEHSLFQLIKTDAILHNLYLYFLANLYKHHHTSILLNNNNNNSLPANANLIPGESTTTTTSGDHLRQANIIHKKILDYLQKAEDNSILLSGPDRQSCIPFDLDFALRLFEDYNIVDAKVKTYALMNFYDLAVKLALDKNNIALAKEYASKHPQDNYKRKLWLKIAVHMINTQQSEKVLQLTCESDSYLKVEDLLPSFGEIHQIDLLKDQICQNLKKYNDDIACLKSEVDSLTVMSDSLKRNINTHSHNYLVLKGKHHCHFCNKNLLKSDHYLFSCLHGFHRNCLVNTMKANSNMIQSQQKSGAAAPADNNNNNNNEGIADEGQGNNNSTSNRTLKRIITLNTFLNQADTDLKSKQEEALNQMKSQLIEEQQAASATSSVSKFFKSIGGAFAQKKDDQTTNLNTTSDVIKKKIESLNIQEIVSNVLSKEEREKIQRKQAQIDEYLQKECYICGLEAVDRVHSEYPSNSDSEWNIS